MNNFKVNRNSWHYKLVYNHCIRMGLMFPHDFCTYWRYVVLSPLFVAFLLFSCLVAIACVVMLCVGIVIVFKETPFEEILLMCGAMLLGYVAYAYSIKIVYWVLTKITIPSKPKRNKSNPKKDGLLKTRYKAWKGKYCPMIEVEK